MIRLPLTIASAALAALLSTACAELPSGASRLEILDSDWHLAGFENSLDLSGIAAANSTQVLIGSDEMFHIQPGVIDIAKRRVESRRPIPLPLESEVKKPEVDIEGVAFSPEDLAYYVTGSHGLGKKKGDLQATRHSVYRVPVDPRTGHVKKDAIRQASLMPWLEETPRLKPHLNRPLQQDGLNIEGLTWADGKLLFGLRAPNHGGRALVVEISPRQLFSGEPAPLTIHEIAVGNGRGIREIAAVRDGFIVLTGNAAAEASKKFPDTTAPGPDTRFDLFFWNGRDPSAAKLGSLPENGAKGEALLVLDDADTHTDLLVIFDGVLGGEPLSIRIHR